MSLASEMLATRLAASSRRRSTGSASAPAKVEAQRIRAVAATESRDALAAAREAEHSRRTAGLASALTRVSQYRVLLASAAEGTDAFVRYASALSEAEGDVAELFALPILPSDIRPRGRFALNVQSHLTRHASHIRNGSMLATMASADDIVSEALALCYAGLTHEDGSPRFELVEVDSAEWVTGNSPVHVPTLGALYRACRRAYWNELARYRAMLGGRVVITSLDALADEHMPATESLAATGMASVDPSLLDWDAPATLAATYWESVATRRPTSQDATLADMLNAREAADAVREERMHALAAHERRMSLASSAHPFGMSSADANAALVDSATAAVVAESGLEGAAHMLGVTALTVERRLSSIRIRTRQDGSTALVRIAPDVRRKRTTRVQRLSERHGMDVTVSRDGTIAGPVIADSANTRTVALVQSYARSRRANRACHNMPMLATGTVNPDAGNYRYGVLPVFREYRERINPASRKSQYVTFRAPDPMVNAYLAAVSASAHERSTGALDETDRDANRGHAGALTAHVVNPDARIARIAARHARIAREAAAAENARVQRRLRFLTIARAVKSGAVTLAAA